MQDEVRALAREREAVILAHNYQVPEVQDVADFVGDSLGLSREAAATDAEVIVFCGVHFMAETAAILSPDKTVLIPDLDAGCSLAASITADQLRAWKARAPRRGRRRLRQHHRRGQGRERLLLHVRQREGGHRRDPGGPGDPLPARHVPRASGWSGSPAASSRSGWASATSTPASARRTSSAGRPRRPTPSSWSTPSAAARASAWRSPTTDPHPLHRGHDPLRRQSPKRALPGRDRDRDPPPPRARTCPGKRFEAVSRAGDLQYMKMITLEKLRDSLREWRYEVTVPEDVADKARLAIDRMVAMTTPAVGAAVGARPPLGRSTRWGSVALRRSRRPRRTDRGSRWSTRAAGR